MVSKEASSQSARAMLLNRRLIACRACGWVHYVMTADEKAAQDRRLERYQLSDTERQRYEAAFRQCLRCEATAAGFRPAAERDLGQAAGHLITPVYLEPKAGTQ